MSYRKVLRDNTRRLFHSNIECDYRKWSRALCFLRHLVEFIFSFHVATYGAINWRSTLTRFTWLRQGSSRNQALCLGYPILCRTLLILPRHGLNKIRHRISILYTEDNNFSWTEIPSVESSPDLTFSLVFPRVKHGFRMEEHLNSHLYLRTWKRLTCVAWVSSVSLSWSPARSERWSWLSWGVLTQFES